MRTPLSSGTCNSLFIFLFSGLISSSSQFRIYDMTRNLANYVFGATMNLPQIYEDMSTEALARRRGYPIETHHVTTDDGYVLELHRIPHGKGNRTQGDVSRYPVIVQHGNFQTSADWLINEPDSDSLAFYLANRGYDVWLGNQRGNEYSTRHKVVPVGSNKFWNFSFHEMGMYDVPATLNYVTKAAGTKKAHYIGFSMGSTAFFAGLSKRSAASDKVGIGIMMGPSTFQENFFNAWVQLAAPVVWIVQIIQRYIGEMPVLPQFLANLLHKILPIICHPKVDLIGVCMSVVQIGFGHDQGLITRERIHQITKVSPSSSPMKAFVHEMQLMGTGRFCEYDYGTHWNLQVYGSEHPPDYNLTNVRAPVALLVGHNDFLAHREDAKTLAKRLPNVVDFKFIDYDHFTHLDFCYARNLSDLVYGHVVKLLSQYDNT